ncbi:Smr/MutS family protein [Desulfobacca acetoxidans]
MHEHKTKDRASPSGFYQPFLRLRENLLQSCSNLPVKPCPPRFRATDDESSLFAVAMQEVIPLDRQGAHSVPYYARQCAPVVSVSEDVETLCRLTELVDGKGHFDLSLSDEYVEGQVPYLDPRVVAALKAGVLPIQDYCDLHGLTVAGAQDCLRQFLALAAARDYRTVLVVHGRGRNSPDHLPVLKSHLQQWLTMKRFRRQVLAFASAQPWDGGVGALYLLLRRLQPCQKREKRRI